MYTYTYTYIYMHTLVASDGPIGSSRRNMCLSLRVYMIYIFAADNLNNNDSDNISVTITT